MITVDGRLVALFLEVGRYIPIHGARAKCGSGAASLDPRCKTCQLGSMN